MKTFSAPAKAIILASIFPFVILVNFFAQTPVPSPTPSPEASPSVSPSPSPSRTPSPTPLPGAQNFHQWGSVTVFNGLPSDSVRAIAQTLDGVMWFGTDNGLARFDGRRVQNFSPGGAETNGILTLAVAPGGELWIGTRSGAFVYFENRFQPIAGTEGMGISAMLLGSVNYLGTDSGYVLRVLPKEGGGYTAEKSPSEALPEIDNAPIVVTSLLEANGLLLVGTSGRGVYSVKDGAFNVVHTSPAPGGVNFLAADQDSLWIATDAARAVSGLYRSTGGDRFERIAAATSKVLTLDANDSGLWAGSERFGLFHIVASKLKKNYTFANTSGGLRSDTVYALFTDREGVLWIGTNRGVSRFDRLGASQETVSDIPNSNFIRTLFRTSSGKLYAGSNRGLFVKGVENWEPVSAYGNRPIFAVSEDAAGRLLVGTQNDTNAWSFADFKSGKYAAVNGLGVVQVKPSGNTVIYPDTSVSSVYATADKLYIGTTGNGLFSFDGQNTKAELAPDVLKTGTIWRMFAASDGALWIAGQHGVFRVRDGVVERIVEIEDVRDVLVDGNEFWAATTVRGLLHGRNDPRFGWVVSSVGFEQGLPSEKAFAIIPVDDKFLIATNRGVVTYKSGSIAPKIIPTRMLSLRAHDLAELASTITLDHPQNSLLVEVAGQSSRTFPEEFQYAFVLKNAKDAEVARQLSNEPQFAPSDLIPGDYTIEAIAFNRDLLASEPLTIRFSIGKAPFPWTATALAVLLLLSLVGLVWAIVEHRRIKQRNRELAAARLDLANEAERERRRIARDLHDQTLADLRNLMISSDKLAIDNGQFRNEIEAVSTEIRRICEDLSPSVLENVGLVAALEFLLDRTVEKRKFTADDALEDRINFPLNVQLQIYRIAQEVLTNIDRHSDADLVEMNVEASADGAFSMTIRDNGTSFQPDGAQKGRGISNIRSRANLINGRVSWKGSGQAGNVFWLRVDDVGNGS